MNKVKVKVIRDPYQVSFSQMNYIVEMVPYDEDQPVGYGPTEAEALKYFIESWQLKYDEEVELEIIEQQ